MNVLRINTTGTYNILSSSEFTLFIYLLPKYFMVLKLKLG